VAAGAFLLFAAGKGGISGWMQTQEDAHGKAPAVSQPTAVSEQ